ncbi:hypothetical protein [Caballeronia telluris]|nr:hypothetical protein [Caballeronia telluris]
MLDRAEGLLTFTLTQPQPSASRCTRVLKPSELALDAGLFVVGLK